jgi:hypothetical protein
MIRLIKHWRSLSDLGFGDDLNPGKLAERPWCPHKGGCISQLFHHCDKAPETINVKEERVFLSHSFGGFSHSAPLLWWNRKSWRKLVEEKACLPHGSLETERARERAWGPTSPFKGMLPVTYLLSIGPASYRFHHLPVTPQVGNQAFSIWAFGGHLRCKASCWVKVLQSRGLEVCARMGDRDASWKLLLSTGWAPQWPKLEQFEQKVYNLELDYDTKCELNIHKPTLILFIFCVSHSKLP